MQPRIIMKQIQVVNKSSWISPNEFSQSYSINTVYNLLVQNNKGEGGHIWWGERNGEFTVIQEP